MKLKFLLFFCFASFVLFGQENLNPLPKAMTDFEQKLVNSGNYHPPKTNLKGITTPPDFPIRTIGEWEELQAITITWDAYFSVLREIVKYAKEEVEVINICQDSTVIKNYLSDNGIDFENLTFIEAPFNTVWMRDYGPNPAYQNDVDSLVFIDWIYNRPRPLDDAIPDVIGEYLDVPVYSTTTAPNDLVHTGGNFMADGLGTGFSSDLVLEENEFPNQWGDSNHSEEDIENLMNIFMGIQQYPKMDALPYDGINHIDMHMKLLDEQTWLIGEFPEGVSDGPQIEANIQYVLNNYQTHWATDFRVERIIQPPCGNGNYPPNCSEWNSAEYRTYTNALFVNKTILVPIYNASTDYEALQTWEKLMPGYKVKGIDCTQIINAGGAIHCITKEIGVADPLWIAHRGLDDLEAIENTTDYVVEAKIKHRSGINEATLYWTIDTTQGYQTIDMSISNADEDLWAASIPQQEDGTHIYYYIGGQSNSGKTTVRPLPAPAGYFDFEIGEMDTSAEELAKFGLSLDTVFPNPASAITLIPVTANESMNIELTLKNVFGRTIKEVYVGKINQGENKYFIHANAFPAGTYFIHLETDNHQQIQKLIIH